MANVAEKKSSVPECPKCGMHTWSITADSAPLTLFESPGGWELWLDDEGFLMIDTYDARCGECGYDVVPESALDLAIGKFLLF